MRPPRRPTRRHRRPAEREGAHIGSATEIEHDLLAIAPDLEPVALLTDDPDVFETDDTVTDVVADDPRVAEGGALPVATGRLAGTQPGDLIGLRVRPGGATLDLAPEPAATPSRCWRSC